MNLLKLAALTLLTASLGACSTFDRLANIGEEPQLTAIDDPTSHPGYTPVTMPMPEVTTAAYQPNSLFRSDARGFFKDQRAAQIGDILTVNVVIDDKAQIDNRTDRERSSASGTELGAGLNSLFGLTTPGLEGSADLDLASSVADGGQGSVNRAESLNTQVAAVVTQILPNGNLVIEGRQEVRVNFEVRDLIVAGIVRPEDIGADNTIDSAKIAEARIAYGGRGQITDVQQPRYGAQILDAIMPF